MIFRIQSKCPVLSDWLDGNELFGDSHTHVHACVLLARNDSLLACLASISAIYRNISLANLYYFCLAPTLTYQIAFPRTPRVRVRRVVGILLGLIACVALFTFLVAQIVSPVSWPHVVRQQKFPDKHHLAWHGLLSTDVVLTLLLTPSNTTEAQKLGIGYREYGGCLHSSDHI